MRNVETEIWIEKQIGNKEYINCELCDKCIRTKGTGKNCMMIHHIDGNHDNHIPENLMFVCPRCHNFKCHDGKKKILAKGWAKLREMEKKGYLDEI